MNNMNIWQQLAEQTQLRWGEVLEATYVHIQLVFFSMIIATILAVTLGILVTRVPWLKTIVLGGTGVLQTVPSLALLGFMIPIFGIGVKTAIAALFLFRYFQLCEIPTPALKMLTRRPSRQQEESV